MFLSKSHKQRWALALLFLLIGGLTLGWLTTPAWGAALVIGGVAWFLALSWPELALAALVAGFQLYPVLFDIAGLQATQVSSGIVYAILTSGAVAGTLLMNPRRAWERMKRPAGIVFVLISFYFIVSWLLLTEKTPSAVQKMWYAIVIMIPSFLAALWMEEARIPRFAWMVAMFSALGALAGVTKRMFGLIPPDVKRLSLSTTSRSLQFAYSIGIGSLFSWILAWQASRKVLAWATFFGSVTFLMIFAAGSRGAFLALGVSVLMFFILSGQWRHLPMLLLMGAFLAAVLLAPYFVIDKQQSTERIWGSIERGAALIIPGKAHPDASGAASEGLDAGEEFVQLTTRRTDYYQASWEMLKKQPLFGVGFGGYSYTNDKRQRYLYPHNYFLEIGAETGLVGLALFSLFLALALWRAFRLLQKRPDVTSWIAVTLMIYALIAGLVSYSITYHTMFWIAFGLVLSLDIPKKRSLP